MHSLAHHHHDTSSAALAGQAPRSLVDLLRERAQQRAGHPALVFLADGETESARLDFHELDRRARAVAATLQRDGLVERPVLLMLPSGVHYVVAFLGCLYAGAVPVPGYPPGNSMHAQRMAHIAADCRAGATIVAPGAGGLESIGACRMLVIADDGVLHEGAHESAWVPVPLQPETLAYLQYTSGSTSQPRGVMVTHGNLLAHAQVWAAEPGLGRDDVFVSWLPLFHDMGLILGLLQMLGAGGTVVLMPPLAFLQRPLRWLAAISRYRGTASYAPNFAYALCAASSDEAAMSALDLSCWAVAGNGAEPVRADTIAAFVRRFAAQGFRSQAMNPGYGLAEATLTVSRQPRLQAAPHIAFDAEALSHGLLAGALEGRRTRTLVACGRDWPGVRARVVDPVTRRLCSDGRVGELWVDGPVVAAGYWQREEATLETFGARLADGEGPFLRTGDLGAWFDGQLFITGRRKDLIVVRGQNHHPQDVEHTVQGAHPMLEPGHGAAFSVEHEGEERLVVVQEVRRSARRRLDGPQVVQAIRAAVAEAHGLQLHAVWLLRPASVHLTSSGKIQRQACKASFLAGAFETLHQWIDPRLAAPAPAGAPPRAMGAADIEAWLRARIASVRGMALAQVRPDTPFTALGLDSMEHVGLSGELSAWLGRAVEPTLLYAHPCIGALARHLAGDEPRRDTRPAPVAPARGEQIAVVGMACRFPQADSAEAFWRLLDEGVDAITEVPARRWDAGALHHAEPGVANTSCSRWGGFIDGIEQFDAAFFGISPREADAMDPQQRLLLQTTWHALEDAGIRADALAGSDAGVFIGAMTHDYELLQLAQGRTLDAYFGSGTQSSVLANRISYVLGLQGPSWTVQTACSSSLVALHQARSSLLAGECGLAIVGGVNALLAPELFVALSQAQMLSPDGRCRAFDARANGYVRSEGCAVLVLKRLADAERDGDRVLGLVAGSAVNQDGRSNGLTAPNGLAQQAVMRRALASAGVEAVEVDCVEAHGTGTALGDPIEVDAIVQTYGRTAGGAPPLSIGSVKSNIGHTEPVAGLAGVVKLLLALHHERIPRTLHVEQINPHIDLRGSRCAIATESRPWPRGPRPRLGGVSSFGFGGTNAHVVLREPPADPAGRDEDAALPPRVEFLMLSARSEAALHAQARRLAARLDDAGSLRALCHTANARRTPMVHRAAFVGATRQELASSLGRFTCGEGDEALRGQVLGEASGRTAFLFSGQGSHDASMGHGLYRTQRVFRRTFDRCDEVLAPRLGFSLAGALYGGQDGVLDLGRTAHAQPALFALEMALAALWQSLGARPDCLLGHSLGEYAAACVAGVFSLEDAALLVAERGCLMDSCTPAGAMVAVHAAEPTLSRLMCEFAASDHHEVAIAARNSADSVVLSGSADAVERVLAQWAPHGASATPLAVARAFHSPLMEPMLAEFEHCLRRVAMKAPSITLVSNITGRAVGEQAAEVSYWLDHVRKPVEFLAGMRCLDEMGCRRFIEIGPHPVLCRLGQRSVEGGHWLPSLQRGDDDERRFALSLAAWGVQGGEVDWTRWAEDRWPDQAPPSLPRPVTLPAYPFQTEAHWFARDRETPAAAVHAAAPAVAPATLTAQPAPDPQVLAALPPEEAKGRVLDWLRAITGTVLRLGAARQREIAPLFGRMPLNQLGLDSLMAVELRQRIHAALGVELPLKHFLTDTTAGDVAAMVYRLLAVQRLARDAAAPAEAESIEELLL